MRLLCIIYFWFSLFVFRMISAETNSEVYDSLQNTDDSNYDVLSDVRYKRKPKIDAFRYMAGIGKRVNYLNSPKTSLQQLLQNTLEREEENPEQNDEHIQQLLIALIDRLKAREAYRSSQNGYIFKKALDPYRFMGNIGKK